MRFFLPPSPLQTALPVVGLAVSNATRAVCHQPRTRPQPLPEPTTKAGFGEWVRGGGAGRRYVLEATGTYSLAGAYPLVAAGAEGAVGNPVRVGRWLHRHLGKDKSDRQDAPWRRFGQQQARGPPEEAALVEGRQRQQATERLLRPQPRVSNALEAWLHQPVVCPEAQRHGRLRRRQLAQPVQQLEAQRRPRGEQRYAAELPLGTCLPGIGGKPAARRLVFAGGLARFATPRQLVAKAGRCRHE